MQTREHDILRLDAGRSKAAIDQVAVEEPLEIRVRGRAVCVTMRTPGHDDELAAGFLAGEGIIRRREEVLAMEPCDREGANMINAVLAPQVAVDFDRLTRYVYASSSCGVCGKATLESLATRFPPVTADWQVAASMIVSLPDTMLRAQETFARTGGLHAAALFGAAGQLLVVREDVGRHNAVDKVLGWALLNATKDDARILLVSGRASFEIVQKAIASAVPVVCAISAPSTLAIDLARSHGVTLVGFLREARMNIYAHPQRIVAQADGLSRGMSTAL